MYKKGHNIKNDSDFVDLYTGTDKSLYGLDEESAKKAIQTVGNKELLFSQFNASYRSLKEQKPEDVWEKFTDKFVTPTFEKQKITFYPLKDILYKNEDIDGKNVMTLCTRLSKDNAEIQKRASKCTHFVWAKPANVNESEKVYDYNEYLNENYSGGSEYNLLEKKNTNISDYNNIEGINGELADAYGLDNVVFVESLNDLEDKLKNMSKFDVAIMNPPYASAEDTFLDIKITNTVKKISHKIISIFPQKMTSRFKSSMEFCDDIHLKQIDFVDGNSIFKISSASTSFTAIYNIDMDKEFQNLIVNGEEIEKGNVEIREKYIKTKYFSKDFIKLVDKTMEIYHKCMNEYKSMCDDSDLYIYEENQNRATKGKNQKKLERVKKFLESGEYKYCLYKGSFNHEYDEVQEYKGDTSIFNGQICWLMNKKNVRDNMRYWMESPLFDLWRRWFFYRSSAVARSGYRIIPALDFDKPVDEFKEYVDKLYHFTDDEIKALKELNVHNADKL